jgi:hypothetical protein
MAFIGPFGDHLVHRQKIAESDRGSTGTKPLLHPCLGSGRIPNLGLLFRDSRPTPFGPFVVNDFKLVADFLFGQRIPLDCGGAMHGSNPVQSV